DAADAAAVAPAGQAPRRPGPQTDAAGGGGDEEGAGSDRGGRGHVPAAGGGGPAGLPDPVADAIRPVEGPAGAGPGGARVAEAGLGGGAEVPRVPPRLPPRRAGRLPPARAGRAALPGGAGVAERQADGGAADLRRRPGGDAGVDHLLVEDLVVARTR